MRACSRSFNTFASTRWDVLHVMWSNYQHIQNLVESLLSKTSNYILPRRRRPTLHRQHRDAVTHDECFPKYERFNYFEMRNLSPTHCLAKHKPLKVWAGWWSLWEERAFLLNKMISAYIYIYSPERIRRMFFFFLCCLYFFFLIIMCELLNTFQYWGLRSSYVGSLWNICTSRMTVIDHFKPE